MPDRRPIGDPSETEMPDRRPRRKINMYIYWLECFTTLLCWRACYVDEGWRATRISPKLVFSRILSCRIPGFLVKI